MAVSVICFLASYLIAFGLEWFRPLSRVSIHRALMLLCAAAGFLAHTIYLINRSTQAQLPPLLSSTHDWMLVLAWMGALFYLFLSMFDRDLPVGRFLWPVVFLLIAAAYFVSAAPNVLIVRDAAIEQNAIRNWAMLHASLLMFGIGGVLLALIVSMMYLAQYRRLRHNRTVQSGWSLPSLERLARLNWWAVILSVPLLTLGMATGLGLGLSSAGGLEVFSLGDPVVLFNGVVWLVMTGLFVWLLKTRRPTGKQVAWLTIWACGFLLVTLVGLQVLIGGDFAIGSGVHQRLSARDTQ